MDDEYLRIEGISKRYGVVEALKNVSFSVRKGEIHTLLGENGAGKSTLVKVIKGEVVPDSGSLFLGLNFSNFLPSRNTSNVIVLASVVSAIEGDVDTDRNSPAKRTPATGPSEKLPMRMAPIR